MIAFPLNEKEKGFTRLQYWGCVFGWVAVLFVIGFLLGLITVMVGGNSDGLKPVYEFLELITYPVFVYLGYKRCIDIGCSKFWSLTAMIVLGAIILGLIPSKKTDG